jgi:TolB protein
MGKKLAAVVGLVVGVGLLTAPSAASAGGERTGNGQWIAYQSSRSGQEGVWLIHPDGTHNHEVATDAPGERLLPDWSPDGRYLALISRSEHGDLIYEFDTVKGKSRPLFPCTDPCAGDDEPAYAPDGRHVAFVRYQGPFSSDGLPADCSLWIGDRRTGAARQLTSNRGTECDREYNPTWSPDGKQLTYWRDPYVDGRPAGTAVFTIRADGTGERRLTNPAMYAGSPSWSPDGRWIVFSTYPLAEFQCCQVSNLYRIHPDGTRMQKLTDLRTDQLRATQPRYAPDGKSLVVTAVTPTTRSLWILPATGGRPRTVAPGGPFPDFYTHGTWQPSRR